MSTGLEVPITGKCLITNYKPEEGRKQNANDFTFFINGSSVKNSGKNTETNFSKFCEGRNIGELLVAIGSIGGNKKEVDAADFQSSKIMDLKDLFNIKKVVSDIYHACARIVFNDGQELRIDFEVENEPETETGTLLSNEEVIKNAENFEKAMAKIEELKQKLRCKNKCNIEIQKDSEGNFSGKVTVTLKKSTTTSLLKDILGDLPANSLVSLNQELLEAKAKEQKDVKKFVDIFNTKDERYENLYLEAGETLEIYLTDFI